MKCNPILWERVENANEGRGRQLRGVWGGGWDGPARNRGEECHVLYWKWGQGVLPTCRWLVMRDGALWGQISTFFKWEVSQQVVSQQGKVLDLPMLAMSTTSRNQGTGPRRPSSLRLLSLRGCYLSSWSPGPAPACAIPGWLWWTSPLGHGCVLRCPGRWLARFDPLRSA